MKKKITKKVKKGKVAKFKSGIVRFEPMINLETVKDGRGAIFTWIPKEPIVEFNLMFYNRSKRRGNHFHPEFNEYLLITAGSGLMVSGNQKEKVYLSAGNCVYIPKNTSHVFHAITDCSGVSFLTKNWDKCSPPIIHEEVL